MYPRYTMYRGSTPNASPYRHTVSASLPRYSQYCIKIHPDCIAVAVHFFCGKNCWKLLPASDGIVLGVQYAFFCGKFC